MSAKAQKGFLCSLDAPQINIVQRVWREIKRPFKKFKRKICRLLSGTPHRVPDRSTFPSLCDVVFIDEDYSPTRHFTYDYENIADTLIKDESVLFIDVGANMGQSAKKAYKYINNVNVISYEPLRSCQIYLKDLLRKYPGYRYKDLALNSTESPITIHEIKGLNGLSFSLKIRDDYQ